MTTFLMLLFAFGFLGVTTLMAAVWLHTCRVDLEQYMRPAVALCWVSFLLWCACVSVVVAGFFLNGH